jgi:hypothetical protein
MYIEKPMFQIKLKNHHLLRNGLMATQQLVVVFFHLSACSTSFCHLSTKESCDYKVLGGQVLVAIKVGVHPYQPKNSFYIL